jgi:predicted nucleic acid-binding protein
VTHRVLVDTSGLLAYLDRDAPEHPAAVAALDRLLTASASLVTHSYVLIETSALVQRRLGLSASRDLHDEIEPVLDQRWVDRELHRAGVSALLAAARREVSLVDWVSFELMRREGIDDAFTFDRHFAERGFRLVTS